MMVYLTSATRPIIIWFVKKNNSANQNYNSTVEVCFRQCHSIDDEACEYSLEPLSCRAPSLLFPPLSRVSALIFFLFAINFELQFEYFELFRLMLQVRAFICHPTGLPVFYLYSVITSI